MPRKPPKPPDSTPDPARTRSERVAAEGAGERLDRWITAHDPDLSRSRVQSLIDDGYVAVDGKKRPASRRLAQGNLVEWTVPETVEVDIVPDSSVDFAVVFEDEHLAVVNKPAGLVVHPAPGHREGTLVNGLLARLDHLSGVGGRARPGLVHRLDRWTTGLLVVAKNDPAHRSLQAQLAARTLRRTYEAICWGAPRDPEGEIDAPLDRHPTDRQRRAVREDGREAQTGYRVLEPLIGCSRLELELRTGRTHQIRVHLQHVGHPVFGDPDYGGDVRRIKGASPLHRPVLKQALSAIGRQALHAKALAFQHPESGDLVRFVADLPADHARALSILRMPESSPPGPLQGSAT